MFDISALEFFYLIALLGCCLCVLAESRGRRIILFLFVSLLFSKNPKTFAYHHALHFASLHCTCTRFALEYYLGLHIGKICIHHLKKKLCISRSSIPCLHGHNAFSLIVTVCILLLLRHNTTSCTTISYF